MINRKQRRRARALQRKRRPGADSGCLPSGRLPGPDAHRPARAALVGAAAGALALSLPVTGSHAQTVVPPSGGPCIVVGTTATCTGNVSAGVDANGATIDTLNVNTLDRNIAPAAGVDGINFSTTGGNAITIRADTAPFQISTTGIAQGIEADVTGNGTISITSVGTITTNGGVSNTFADAINANVNGDGSITVTSTGDLVAGDGGIEGYVGGNGDISVTSLGNINSNGQQGILGYVAGNGNVTINSTGAITALASEGIRGEVDEGGDIVVRSTGAINTADRGIFANLRGGLIFTGNIVVASTGDISTQNADADGIHAYIDDGGTIRITSTGNISTQNTNAEGIYAYIGGSGSISINSTGDLNVADNGIEGSVYADGFINVVSNGSIVSRDNGGIDVDIGGDGNVSVRSTGTINALQTGIDAQVLGAGDITLGSTGDVTAGGDGMYVRILGNGNVTISSAGTIVAGDGGIDAYVGGNGNVTIDSTGPITASASEGIRGEVDEGGDIVVRSTGAINSADRGIFANLRGGLIFTGNIVVASTGDISTQNADADGIHAYIDDGGTIRITSTGDISTRDTNAEGIYAYIGGSGSISINSAGDFNVADNGIEGSVYADGAIHVVSNGTIVSRDNGGIDVDIGGDGSISVTSTGNITAPQDGIDAQIAGAGHVTVNATGDITVANAGSDGIVTRVSAGSASTVTVTGGRIQGGSGTGAGTSFTGPAGSTNTLNTSGTVTLLSLGGIAVDGGAGNTTINNFGTLNTVTNGAIDLGGGTNAFNNWGGALFNAGGIVNLGAGNIFSNSGAFSPGASSTILTTAITGTVIQDGGGIVLSSVDPSAGTGDLVSVTETATLAGNVQAFVINPALGDRSVTILSAAGGTTNNGLGLLASPALQASLSFPNANDVVLSYSIDFSAGGLNPNQTALAGSLNSAVAAGTGGIEPVLLALLNTVFTIGDYRNALNQLLPEVYLNTETATLFSSEDFIENLFSCRLAGQNHTALSEGECYWARPRGRFLDRDSDSNTIGFDETAGGLAVGAQVAVAPNWFAGFALGYERASLDTDSGAGTDSNRFSGGLSLKHQAGAFLLGAAISGGVSGNHTQRPIGIGGAGGFNATAESNYAIKTLTGQARAAYVFQFRDWFAKPLVDVTATYLSRDGVTETGAGSANLAVGGSDETFFSVTPALEIGGDFALSDTSVIRPYVRAGVSYYTDSDHGLTASFVNAPAGTSAFSITSGFDDVFADVAAGATAFFDNGSTLGLSYEGLISSDTRQHGISLKGTIRF